MEMLHVESLNLGDCDAGTQKFESYCSQVRSGQEITYSCYEPLKEAIEKRLTSSVRELTRVITVNKIRNNDQNHKYDAMTQEMKQNGYCDTCCNVILKYAANNLWKD